jgi:hypothetical protein
MAKNKGGRRVGAIRGRTQFMLPNGHYAKRDRQTGEILSIKANKKPYKNVIIERTADPASAETGDTMVANKTAWILPLPLGRAA